MWKLCATGAAMSAALVVSGCGGGPSLGGWLSNSYITPAADQPTAKITFAGQSDDPNVLVFLITQSPGAWTPSGERQIIMLTANRPWDGIPAHGSFNTINKSFEEADRTIAFGSSGPLYFSAFLANGEFTYGSGGGGSTYTCEIGFTFTPEPNHEYAATVVGENGFCTVELKDKANGRVPASYDTYSPRRR